VIAATSKSESTPLRLVELASRPLRDDEVRVAVRAIGVNPVDWKMRGLGSPLGLAQRVLGPSGPLVVGIDFSGEVTAVGARITDTRVGDRVVGGTDFSRAQRGSYADEVVVREDQFAPLPPDVSFDDAACLPVPGVTAWRALTELGGLTAGAGQRALILGASGGVGLLAIQLARSLGAAVTGVCSTRNTALVERLGATAVDYTLGDPLAQARAHGPFDVIVNTVGADAYPLRGTVPLLTPRGVVALVVVTPSDYPSLALRPRVRAVLGRPTRAGLVPLVNALQRKEIVTLLDEVMPLAEAERAHAKSRTGKVVGKILLRPG
jgi:NADPH2:quinone reductase